MPLPEPERTLIDIAKAMHTPDMDVVRDLLQQHANLSLTDSNGFTALHWAAFMAHEQLVIELVASGANVRHRNHEGNSAATLATSSPQLNDNSSHREVATAQRMSAIHHLLLQAGDDEGRIINAGHHRCNIVRRDQWLDEASAAIKYWNNTSPHSATDITPKLVCQFASFRREDELMTAEYWRDDIPQLTTLLTQLPLYLSHEILSRNPHLVEWLTAAPTPHIHASSADQHRLHSAIRSI